VSTDVAIYNIPKHRRGDTWDGIPAIGIKENGVPVNLSGAVISIEFREDYDAPVALTLSTLTSTISVLPTLSAVTIPAFIVNLPPATYQYDLQVVYPTTRTKTYMQGNWEIYFDVTK